MSNQLQTAEVLSDQYLLSKNQIYLFGPVNTAMAARVIPQMHYIEQKMLEENLPEEERVLTLLINSPGGAVTDGLAIYDTINMLDCKVRTICVGLAASMGAVLLTAGAAGKRSALPHSRVMIHQPLGGAQGQASDIEITAREIIKTKHELYEILSNHSGVDIAKIEQDADRDYWMTSYEARDYGLIDQVLGKRSK